MGFLPTPSISNFSFHFLLGWIVFDEKHDVILGLFLYSKSLFLTGCKDFSCLYCCLLLFFVVVVIYFAWYALSLLHLWFDIIIIFSRFWPLGLQIFLLAFYYGVAITCLLDHLDIVPQFLDTLPCFFLCVSSPFFCFSLGNTINLIFKSTNSFLSWVKLSL